MHCKSYTPSVCALSYTRGNFDKQPQSIAEPSISELPAHPTVKIFVSYAPSV